MSKKVVSRDEIRAQVSQVNKKIGEIQSVLRLHGDISGELPHLHTFILGALARGTVIEVLMDTSKWSRRAANQSKVALFRDLNMLGAMEEVLTLIVVEKRTSTE